MIILLTLLALLFNLIVSIANAYYCGKVWAESKVVGGWFRLVTWCGAILSALGFTMIWAFLIGTITYSIGFLDVSMFTFFSDLIYVLIAIPILGTGTIITIDCWIKFFREKSLLNLSIASLNTIIDAYNMYHVIENFGDAFSNVKENFSNLFDLDSDDILNSSILFVIFLSLFTLFAGVGTTYLIIQKFTAPLPIPETTLKRVEKGVYHG